MQLELLVAARVGRKRKPGAVARYLCGRLRVKDGGLYTVALGQVSPGELSCVLTACQTMLYDYQQLSY